MLENRLKDLAPPPPARSAFRAELKDAFVSGGLARPSSAPEAAPSESRPRPLSKSRPRPLSKSRPRPLSKSRPRPLVGAGAAGARGADHPLSSKTWSWQLVTGLLATAAAVVLIVLFPGDEPAERRGRNWNVVAVGSELEVDSVRFDTTDGVRLANAVNQGHALASLGASLRVSCASGYRFGMEPASSLGLPALPALATSTAPVTPEESGLVFQLDEGTLHLSTNTDYAGQAIIVQTPHAKVRVTGSLLSIEVFEDKGTCICVASGEAEVEVLSGDHDRVEVRGDTSCFVFDEDREPALGPSDELVPPDHLQPLFDFHDEAF